MNYVYMQQSDQFYWQFTCPFNQIDLTTVAIRKLLEQFDFRQKITSAGQFFIQRRIVEL